MKLLGNIQGRRNIPPAFTTVYHHNAYSAGPGISEKRVDNLWELQSQSSHRKVISNYLREFLPYIITESYRQYSTLSSLHYGVSDRNLSSVDHQGKISNVGCGHHGNSQPQSSQKTFHDDHLRKLSTEHQGAVISTFFENQVRSCFLDREWDLMAKYWNTFFSVFIADFVFPFQIFLKTFLRPIFFSKQVSMSEKKS